MGKLSLLFFIFFTGTIFSQDLNLIEKKLNTLIEKRMFWSDDSSDTAYDSLAKYNKEFEKYILSLSSKNPKTLTYNFTKIKTGLTIISSEDGLFRIYTWNTFEGGSMQYYKNVYQYNIAGKVYSKSVKNENGSAGCNFYEMNQVDVNGKPFYITNSVRVGSSAAFYYEAKIFSIEDAILNENAKLIKTKTGIKNTLGYDVDLSSSSNRDRKDGVEGRDYMELIYDKENKTIILPLINGDGKITKNKIKYKFTGTFFEKV